MQHDGGYAARGSPLWTTGTSSRGSGCGLGVRPSGLAAAALALLYFFVALNWSYSTGERAGWVQKLSKKGWVCKTWEGEMVMVSMPGSVPEKFYFTVRDDAVAQKINDQMGKRVSLIYDQHVGIPFSCFGETVYFVSDVKVVE